MKPGKFTEFLKISFRLLLAGDKTLTQPNLTLGAYADFFYKFLNVSKM